MLNKVLNFFSWQMFKGTEVTLPKGKLEIFTIHSLKITKISGIVYFVMLFQMTLLISW